MLMLLLVYIIEFAYGEKNNHLYVSKTAIRVKIKRINDVWDVDVVNDIINKFENTICLILKLCKFLYL